MFALAILTIPVAGQALGCTGQWYGLELIGLALAIFGVGVNLNYKLITYWGAATITAEVLYQIRSVLFALPEYLISAVLGVEIVAVAIVLLGRRKPPQEGSGPAAESHSSRYVPDKKK